MVEASFARSSLLLALLASGMVSGAISVAPAYAASNACTLQTNPFEVTQAYWGTPGSPESAYPGSQNVPLTVSMLFSGPCTSPQTTFLLNLHPYSVATFPFIGINGETQPKDVTVNSITPNSVVSETFYLNIEPNATTGVTYQLPLLIQFSNNTSSDSITQVSDAPIALYGPVQINFGAQDDHLLAGQLNNVTITISNTGSASSGPVALVATPPSGVTLFNQLNTTAALGPGSTSTQLLRLFVPSSMSGSAFDLSITGKYLDAYLNNETTTQTVGFTVASSSGLSPTSFIVLAADWGGSTSTSSPLPGTQDEALVVSLQYLGAAPVTSLQGTLQLPPGMTDLNGRGTAVAYSAAGTSQYGSVALTFYVDIGAATPAGSYNYSLTLGWMTSGSAGLTQTAVLTPPPIAELQSSFQVQGVSWGKPSNSTSTSPAPGDQDVPLAVTLQYLGTTPVTNIKGTLTLLNGVTDLNGQQKATAFASTASAGQQVSLTFDLDIGSSISPGSYAFPLVLSWLTSVSTSMSQNGTVTPPPILSATTEGFPLSLVQQNSTISAGSRVSAAFTLTNAGTATIYSPTFSLQVASTVVVTSTGSTIPAGELAPGSSEVFSAQVTSDPGATPGVYGGTVTVVFGDSGGASHTQTFPVSFTVQGTVILVLQDASATQSTTGFTVTGSILNEGSTPAYYASISGLLGRNAATPAYIGEIDPNTPVPFSVTVPFAAPAAVGNSSGTASITFSRGSRSGVFGFPGAGNLTRTGNFSLPAGFNGTLFGRNSTSPASGVAIITLTLSYKDSFGSDQTQRFPVSTTILPASALTSGSGFQTGSTGSSKSSELTDIAYGVVGVIAASLIVGTLMLRRYRGRRLASLPTESRGDRSVI
jgi:uncharacterized membrane protein